MKAIFYIAIALAVVLIGFALYKRHEIIKWLNRPEIIRRIKQACVLAEEYIIGTKKGQERLEWVCEKVLSYAPPAIRAYITKEMLAKFVTMIFESIAVTMDDGTRKAVWQ